MFTEHVTFEDLRSAGLKVGPAREFLQYLQPGGSIYNHLVLSGRLIPTKRGHPKLGAFGNGGNPNDGSSISDLTSNSISQKSRMTLRSARTAMTTARIPRRVKNRVNKVGSQLYEQDRLAEHLGESFATLNEAHQTARQRGLIDDETQRRLRRVNGEANAAK